MLKVLVEKRVSAIVFSSIGIQQLFSIPHYKGGMRMKDCLFCRIAAGEIPAEKVYEDDHAVAFRDISPQAPVHLLVIPRDHYAVVQDIPDDKMAVMSHLYAAVKKVVAQEGLQDKGGYRLVINAGPNAGQAVPHIHIHVLAGRSLQWPPG
jgi:histidine triad (HIT) family protein